MRRILITGGLGYLGGHISQQLLHNNYIIISTRIKNAPKELKKNTAHEFCIHDDLLDYKSFPDNIDTVIHLAALNEKNCELNSSEAINVNVIQTKVILENSIKTGVKNFIYFSTFHVYGDNLFDIITEKTPRVPKNIYAITHKDAEDIVIEAGNMSRINSVVIRLSNSFGVPMNKNEYCWNLVINNLIRQSVERKKIILQSNGKQFRDFISITDVAIVVNKLINKIFDKNVNIYNLSSGISIDINTVAEKITNKYLQKYNELIFIKRNDNDFSNYNYFTLDNSSLIQDIGVFNTNFEYEIENLFNFCKLNFTYFD